MSAKFYQVDRFEAINLDKVSYIILDRQRICFWVDEEKFDRTFESHTEAVNEYDKLMERYGVSFKEK